MKSLKKVILGVALGFVVIANASAQTVDTGVNSANTNTNASQSTAANQGVSATNNFNTTTPTDTTANVKYSGFTGSNTSVGLGSFSSSFSSDYCGGTAQAAGSVPFVTAAGGKPVLMEPGYACDDHRTAVHAMEFAATYGNASIRALELAKQADAASDKELAKQYKISSEAYAKLSAEQAKFATLMECGHSESARRNSRLAGIDCPLTDEEKTAEAKKNAEASKQQAIASNQPVDPFVRQRMGLPVLH